MNLALRVDEDAAKEQNQASNGEDKGGYFQPNYYQAYRRKVSILASDTGWPVISRKRSINSCRCLVGMFCRARWLSLSWISCVVIAIDDWTIDDWTKVVYYGNGSRLVRERFENDSVKMRKNGHNSRS